MKLQYKDYTQAIRTALAKGYQFFTFDQELPFKQNTRSIVIRHDVDIDVALALKIAEVEYDVGISATYFFRLHAEKYNLLSYNSRLAINKILEMKHKIGFHYDCEYTDNFGKSDHWNAIIKEMRLFEEALGVKPIAFTVHQTKNAKIDIEPKMFENSYFTSDSGGRWNATPLDELIANNTPHIYALLHPFYWFKETNLENL